MMDHIHVVLEGYPIGYPGDINWPLTDISTPPQTPTKQNTREWQQNV